jgi:hypothetical protein
MIKNDVYNGLKSINTMSTLSRISGRSYNGKFSDELELFLAEEFKNVGVKTL